MIPMSVAEVAHAVSGRIAAAPDATAGTIIAAGTIITAATAGQDTTVASQPSDSIVAVVTDSRQATPGSLFVAIPGERVDGHDFLDAAARNGALAAIVDHEVPGAPLAQIIVADCVTALGELARYNLERRRALPGDFSIVAITGSVGKTTTKDLLHALLGPLAPTIAPIGSFNNNIGLPITALQVGADTRFLIAEMGANHVGEIARLTTIAPPDISVVLKVGTAHLGEFGSVERIAQAKSEIVRGLLPGGVTVLNADDSRVSAMSRLAPADVLWFGLGEEPHNVHPGMLSAVDIDVDELDHPQFTLVRVGGDAEQPQSQQRAAVQLGLAGSHNVMNALAAASVASYFGMSLADIARGLQDVSHISPHRMALSQVDDDDAAFTLIDDSFNANPDSMKAGIEGLRSWKRDELGIYRVAVLGAMLELGDNETALHESIGAYAATHGVDAVVAVGGEAHLDALAAALARGASQPASQPAGVHISVDLVHDAEHARSVVKDLARAHPGMVVLLKGSHVSGLSALAEQWAPRADA
ncbi:MULTISPECIES: UDP-N-acetylmuramoyl-tripeptide--D-alanyl-D-alanine ligase [Bifidobacterium]|jgi:UDP-N-acetylmuramoyl-tripeptide--D-alanyl-D-alanine ligase|uniref:UDP-N-acetylmuramoyl-tripeptide--D-alanyl-D-alanine ligase n=1 Tax=Bifidobacterium tibiigranuli TaxID=2172043 RepID=A0A5N6S276_9BIFI|nr:UDP-N-acetylmuramoyl-tripeptide--D-alanyl-D-alanine ligase [Bifidobacterium tibiigranuli]KAE8128330.1 UDP-N-acetylmuramoyl-tripeptide--D-alanyl-D-alanine ligase [Bifidobacterium tibiigranuli]KAE8128655.1 UDP-N-acetylmuramoyl-tripeptide--D-alanyl-D-alanine ligase [Bifidobacterium tibiigranuli]MCI1254676.1 UDP-N-acetylmuramoyl-tripeptide--D-alanyl-D-alanine ligase [Bifidobacterium tibiigranuli]